MENPDNILTQNAYVVRDIQASMKAWINDFGIGPFFLMPHINLKNVMHRGIKIDLDISAAVALSGNVQIELIEQHNVGPSAYRDVVPTGREGFHHICLYPKDYDAIQADYVAKGMPIAMEGEVASNGTRFCYMDATARLNCMVELVDVPGGGGTSTMWGPLREATENWDGVSDPIRVMEL